MRNEKECICSAPNCCDTEQRSASQPGSVASGTHCIFHIQINVNVDVCLVLYMENINIATFCIYCQMTSRHPVYPVLFFCVSSEVNLLEPEFYI